MIFSSFLEQILKPGRKSQKFCWVLLLIVIGLINVPVAQAQFNLNGSPVFDPKPTSNQPQLSERPPENNNFWCNVGGRDDISPPYTNMCPVVEWDGFVFWIYNNSSNMGGLMIAVYNADVHLLSYKTYGWNISAFRYIHTVSTDSSGQTFTFIGQGGHSMTIPWSDFDDLVREPRISLEVSSTTVQVGQAVDLTARIRGAASLSEEISFSQNGTELASRPITDGVATYSWSTTGLSSGQYTIEASYPGDTYHTNSTSLPVTVTLFSNRAPTDIGLSSTTVNQNAGVNAVVGTLTSTDLDDDDSHTYTLDEGDGDTHNASFNISDTFLRANDALNLAAGNYSVRIRTTDNMGDWYEKVFMLTVVDNIPPTITINTDKSTLKAGETATLTFTLSEVSDNFGMASINAVGGVLSGFSANTLEYTATFTPTPNSTQTATINVPAGAFTDAAGNGNVAATQETIEVRTQIPDAPLVPVLLDPSGIDNTTSNNMPVFTGVAEANSTVTLLIDNVIVMTRTADSSGNWVISLDNPLLDGTYAITATATNADGNVSSASQVLMVTIDTVIPTLDSVAFEQTAVALANQSAVSLILAGAEPGTLAHYSISSSGGGAEVIATNLEVSTATQVFTGIDVSGLGDGTLEVTLTLTDRAGNESVARSATVLKDTQAPKVSSVAIASGNYSATDVINVTVTLDKDVIVTGDQSTLAIDIGGTTYQAVFVSSHQAILLYQYTVQTNDNTDATGVIALASGLSLHGNSIRDALGNDAVLAYAQISNANAQVDTIAPVDPVVVSPASEVYVNADEYLISGTHTENSVTVALYLDADNDGIPDTTLVLDSFVVNNGSWELIAPLLANSANNFVVIAEDAAGNTSSAVRVPTVTEDSIAPVAPSAPELSAESDTGASDSDGITQETTPILTGTAEAHSAVILSSDQDGEVGTDIADASGDWSITTSELSEGVHSLTATATDAAGNVSDVSEALSITIDTQAPTLTAVTDQAIGLGVTSEALSVTVGDNSSDPDHLELTVSSSDVSVIPDANIVLGGSGANRTVTLTSLGSGVTTITLNVEDEAGNITTGSFTVTVNSRPIISGVPDTRVNQDVLYRFIPSASDIDDDTLLFSITNAPAWGSFNPLTGELSGTPTRDDVGVTTGIVISVSDGELAASLPAFDLEVDYVNEPPVIGGEPLLVAYVGALYEFTPSASDADGDVLTFSASSLPGWLSLDTDTGRLSGVPGGDVAGEVYNVTLSVSDGTDSATLPVFSLGVEYDGETPVLTPPGEITLNASGLYTAISLRELLALPPGASQQELDTALSLLATDSAQGNTCCTTRPEGQLTDAGDVLLRPGRHEVTWTTVNEQGLSASAIQVVNLRPLVSFNRDQVARRGTDVEVRVLLNGPSPVYPLDIPFVVDNATTALPEEHNAAAGLATFDQPGQQAVVIPLQLADLENTPDSTLVLRLEDQTPAGASPTDDLFDINAGAIDRHVIHIRATVTPILHLSLEQQGSPRLWVAADAGPVTATARVRNGHPDDTFIYDWSATDNVLVDTDGDASDETWVFDPSGLEGRHRVQARITDSKGETQVAHLNFRILPFAPVLDPNTDSNGNGIDDLTEGYGDSNQNGIPDYLDIWQDNVLPGQLGTTDPLLLECEPGLLCRLGQFALVGQGGGAELQEDDFETQPGLLIDKRYRPVGGVFDVDVLGLTEQGQSIRIVIPQHEPIPAESVYRQFLNGEWVGFAQDDKNRVHSAPGHAGRCPPPGSDLWEPGLVAGYACVQVTIEDGGPNDADGVANAAVSHLGAVGELRPVESVKTQSRGGSASVGLLVLLGLLLVGRHGRRLAPVALLLAAAQAHAGGLPASVFLQADFYQVKTDRSAGVFSAALLQESYEVGLDRYDVSREGYQLSVGYRWNSYTYTQLGYLNLGRVDVDMSVVDIDLTQEFGQTLKREYPFTGEGAVLIQGLSEDITPQWSVLTELGLFFWERDVALPDAVSGSQSDSGVDPLLGLRVHYRFDTAMPIGISLGVRRIFTDQRVDLLGIALDWGF